jgi:hypothetical protein
MSDDGREAAANTATQRITSAMSERDWARPPLSRFSTANTSSRQPSPLLPLCPHQSPLPSDLTPTHLPKLPAATLNSQTPYTMEDPSGSGGWRFAQCFGDKGEVEDITEGTHLTAVSPPRPACSPTHSSDPSISSPMLIPRPSSRHYLYRGV